MATKNWIFVITKMDQTIMHMLIKMVTLQVCLFQSKSLRKIPKFYLIYWFGNFVERHSFGTVLGESPETLRKLCLSTKFPHQEIRWNFRILRNFLNYLLKFMIKIEKQLSRCFLKAADLKISGNSGKPSAAEPFFVKLFDQ